MTEKEFNLSEKLTLESPHSQVIKDVKEFIRLLKEEFCCCVGQGKGMYKCTSCRLIDKLAGEKLTK